MLTTDFDISRIAVTNPAVADATVVAAARDPDRRQGARHHQPDHLGRRPAASQYDLVVEPAVTTLQQQLQTLFPGEDIQVSASDDATILSGQVSSTNVMLRAGEIAQASSAKRSVINLLQVPGGSESQQVMLQVRFAEVNRRVLTGARHLALRQRGSDSAPHARPSSSRRRISTTRSRAG